MKKWVERWPKREELLRSGFREEIGLPMSYDRYRAQRVAVKLAVQTAKRMADRRWGERLGNDFEGNKNMFWKEVKRVGKGEQARKEMVKTVNGQILRDGVEVKRRWAEYFEQVLTSQMSGRQISMKLAIGGCRCWEI